MQKWIRLLLATLLALLPLQGFAHAGGADMTDLIIYQIVTDRFYDGNTGNNDPADSAGQYSSNQSNWRFYFGGDWAGITQKLPYLSNMGVGAIWISPPVRNLNQAVWNPSYSAYEGSYHGYWAMDFYKPESHFGTWTEFDNMVSTAHGYGIKVIVDWAPNHSNYAGKSIDGALYQNGTLVTTYTTDPTPSYYHHNGDITQWDDRYETQYKSMVALSDFAGESNPANQYLKGAVDTWLNHGIDGLRIDAVKLMPSGWQKAYYDHIYANRSIFMFGEWFDVSGAPLYGDAVKFANTSGTSILNFDLNQALRDAFMSGQPMSRINDTINRNAGEFSYLNQLPVFVDNHDIKRFLSVNSSTQDFELALIAGMTVPGIPVVYYGDEQYLHNDTSGGNDPYNRPMMSSWSQTTKPYQFVQKLSALRKQNPALRYGSNTQRWINSNVYIYERKFYDDVVMVAINKGASAYNITGLYTAMPAGSYSDQLTGLMGGSSVTVTAGSPGNNPVTAFTLGSKQAAVWHYAAPTPSTPQVGNVNPVMGRSGNTVTVTGKGFGASPGTVKVGGVTASVQSWASGEVRFTVPTGAPTGQQNVTITTGGGTSNGIAFNVLSGEQVPVTFKVRNASPTNLGDYIFLTGNKPELSNWSTSRNSAVGPLITHSGMYPDWLGVASVPAGTGLEYKYIKITGGGAVTWENGSNHSFTTPAAGNTGYVEVWWQY